MALKQLLLTWRERVPRWRPVFLTILGVALVVVAIGDGISWHLAVGLLGGLVSFLGYQDRMARKDGGQ